MAPLKGYVWNPLIGLPRNQACPCMSGKKFKACCLKTMQRTIPAEKLDEYEAQMKQPNLFFITHENFPIYAAAELRKNNPPCEGEHDYKSFSVFNRNRFFCDRCGHESFTHSQNPAEVLGPDGSADQASVQETNL